MSPRKKWKKHIRPKCFLSRLRPLLLSPFFHPSGKYDNLCQKVIRYTWGMILLPSPPPKLFRTQPVLRPLRAQPSPIALPLSAPRLLLRLLLKYRATPVFPLVFQVISVHFRVEMSLSKIVGHGPRMVMVIQIPTILQLMKIEEIFP